MIRRTWGINANRILSDYASSNPNETN